MPDSATDPIAASVRAELARAGKSGRQLSAELNWPYPQLWRRLTGDVPFSAAELGRVATHLGIDIACLYRPPTAPAERAS